MKTTICDVCGDTIANSTLNPWVQISTYVEGVDASYQPLDLCRKHQDDLNDFVRRVLFRNAGRTN